MLTILRGIELLNVVEGKIAKPEKPGKVGDGPAAGPLAAYSTPMKAYVRNDSTDLLLITINILDQALEKVMRFRTSKEV
ncbi:hypothetical protein RR46_00008 [Papilio xuthus]|uniref:Uncharacterized protein n=1 Tax=Papilio xuthus TaxID=66420 RepID=A0A0N1IQL5_PAPXU|nr:hypothetical protein RR46_00008 [Papilio xuthus]